MNNCNDKSKTENKEPAPNDNNNDNNITSSYIIAARISSVGFEMIVTVLFGVWLDYLFGSVVIFTVLGAIFGVIIAFLQLMKFAAQYP
ncbi:MAG: AtpZ/AtpI family protein [Planctomycetaceae bacterium]|jgi:F0F1-type ATP synthase assembly protein I|nr:AtpZ/AtpI family protein [Planctomycetaceae bacterium]